jgi:hypothetical protein
MFFFVTRYKHYYKIWVQVINPHSADGWIHCLPLGLVQWDQWIHSKSSEIIWCIKTHSIVMNWNLWYAMRQQSVYPYTDEVKNWILMWGVGILALHTSLLMEPYFGWRWLANHASLVATQFNPPHDSGETRVSGWVERLVAWTCCPRIVTSVVVATHLFGVARSKFGINNSLFFFSGQFLLKRKI